MPRRFLSKGERIRLSRFPAEVSDNDCVVYFTLTPSDLELVGRRRRDENHLGFIVNLHFAVSWLFSGRNSPITRECGGLCGESIAGIIRIVG